MPFPDHRADRSCEGTFIIETASVQVWAVPSSNGTSKGPHIPHPPAQAKAPSTVRHILCFAGAGARRIASRPRPGGGNYRS